jgi:hypothetical protein
MTLTGRFMFRRSTMGHIVLVIEEDVRNTWRLSRKNPTRRRWRDANLMDLAAPEMRALIDLRHKPRIDLHHYYYTPAERVPQSIEGADLQTLRGATDQLAHHAARKISHEGAT